MSSRQLLLLVSLVVMVGCDLEDGFDGGSEDAWGGDSAPCPNAIKVGQVVDVPSPNEDPLALTWTAKGYGMEAGSGLHDGRAIHEVLVAIEDEDSLSNDFSPVGVELCPFTSGDFELEFTCGTEEKSFTLGERGQLRYEGRLVVRYPATSNVFWDSHAVFAEGSILSTVNRALARRGDPPFARCRLGCIQTYHCDDESTPPVALFFRIEDFILEQMNDATTVVVQVVDEAGVSH